MRSSSSSSSSSSPPPPLRQRAQAEALQARTSSARMSGHHTPPRSLAPSSPSPSTSSSRSHEDKGDRMVQLAEWRRKKQDRLEADQARYQGGGAPTNARAERQRILQLRKANMQAPSLRKAMMETPSTPRPSELLLAGPAGGAMSHQPPHRGPAPIKQAQAQARDRTSVVQVASQRTDHRLEEGGKRRQRPIERARELTTVAHRSSHPRMNSSGVSTSATGQYDQRKRLDLSPSLGVSAAPMAESAIDTSRRTPRQSAPPRSPAPPPPSLPSPPPPLLLNPPSHPAQARIPVPPGQPRSHERDRSPVQRRLRPRGEGRTIATTAGQRTTASKVALSLEEGIQTDHEPPPCEQRALPPYSDTVTSGSSELDILDMEDGNDTADDRSVDRDDEAGSEAASEMQDSDAMYSDSQDNDATASEDNDATAGEDKTVMQGSQLDNVNRLSPSHWRHTQVEDAQREPYISQHPQDEPSSHKYSFEESSVGDDGFIESCSGSEHNQDDIHLSGGVPSDIDEPEGKSVRIHRSVEKDARQTPSLSKPRSNDHASFLDDIDDLISNQDGQDMPNEQAGEVLATVAGANSEMDTVIFLEKSRTTTKEIGESESPEELENAIGIDAFDDTSVIQQESKDVAGNDNTLLPVELWPLSDPLSKELSNAAETGDNCIECSPETDEDTSTSAKFETIAALSTEEVVLESGQLYTYSHEPFQLPRVVKLLLALLFTVTMVIAVGVLTSDRYPGLCKVISVRGISNAVLTWLVVLVSSSSRMARHCASQVFQAAMQYHSPNQRAILHNCAKATFSLWSTQDGSLFTILDRAVRKVGGNISGLASQIDLPRVATKSLQVSYDTIASFTLQVGHTLRESIASPLMAYSAMDRMAVKAMHDQVAGLEDAQEQLRLKLTELTSAHEAWALDKLQHMKAHRESYELKTSVILNETKTMMLQAVTNAKSIATQQIQEFTDELLKEVANSAHVDEEHDENLAETQQRIELVAVHLNTERTEAVKIQSDFDLSEEFVDASGEQSVSERGVKALNEEREAPGIVEVIERIEVLSIVNERKAATADEDRDKDVFCMEENSLAIAEVGMYADDRPEEDEVLAQVVDVSTEYVPQIVSDDVDQLVDNVGSGEEVAEETQGMAALETVEVREIVIEQRGKVEFPDGDGNNEEAVISEIVHGEETTTSQELEEPISGMPLESNIGDELEQVMLYGELDLEGNVLFLKSDWLIAKAAAVVQAMKNARSLDTEHESPVPDIPHTTVDDDTEWLLMPVFSVIFIILALWTVYVLRRGRYLIRQRQISRREWQRQRRYRWQQPASSGSDSDSEPEEVVLLSSGSDHIPSEGSDDALLAVSSESCTHGPDPDQIKNLETETQRYLEIRTDDYSEALTQQAEEAEEEEEDISEEHKSEQDGAEKRAGYGQGFDFGCRQTDRQSERYFEQEEEQNESVEFALDKENEFVVSRVGRRKGRPRVTSMI